MSKLQLQTHCPTARGCFRCRYCAQTLEGIALGHDSTVWALSFRRDGSQLASVSADRTIKVWDTGEKDGRPFYRLAATLSGHHERDVYSVSFSASGALATACGVPSPLSRHPAPRGPCCSAYMRPCLTGGWQTSEHVCCRKWCFVLDGPYPGSSRELTLPGDVVEVCPRAWLALHRPNVCRGQRNTRVSTCGWGMASRRGTTRGALPGRERRCLASNRRQLPCKLQR